jgi:hypothetical protein
MLKEQGLALITVIVIFAIVLLSVAGTIVLARTELSTSKNNERAEQAFSLAESGIDWAAAKIRANPDFSTTTTYIPVTPSGTVAVQVFLDSQTKTATVISYSVIPVSSDYPKASRAIEAVFGVKLGILSGESLFERAITANGQITSKNGAEIRVSSNLPNKDDISLLSNYSGPGDAVSFDKLDYLDGKVGVMSGETAAGVPTDKVVVGATPDPVRTLTPTEIDAWRQAAIKEGHYYSGTTSWGSGVTLNGIYFFDGNLEVDNKLSGRGTIVVNGSFTAGNKADILSESLALIVIGDMDIDMKNKATITGYIYCGGNVVFKNKLELVGSIAAIGSVEFKNNGDITYQNLGEGGYYLPPGFSQTNATLDLKSWSEIPVPGS